MRLHSKIMHAPRLLLPILLLLLALPSVAAAQLQDPDHATVSATIAPASVAPGGEAVIELAVDIKPGFHSQSATPSAKNFIAFRITPTPADAVTFGQIEYPPGHDKTYPALGKLNVYTGRVVARIPVRIAPTTPAGELKLAGKVRYQICDDTTCFMPQNRPFEVSVQVGEGSAAATTQSTTPPPPTTQQAASTDVPPPPPAADAGVTQATTLGTEWTIFTAFGGAILAGIIFNIMPCVLPVVPLKAIGFYEVSQHNRAKSLLFGLTFSLGLIASFAVLGLFVVVLRTLDWGELFQLTWFRLTIITILVAMAIGTFGFFSVNIPTSVYRFSPRHDTYFGNFLFGILTALLSTPCTFGLLVGLLTFATTQAAFIGMTIVILVGVGMALPYLILSAFPELARRFPRTGPWAEVVKQLMAFLLLGAAVFFAKPFIDPILGADGMWWLLFAVVLGAGIFLVVKTVAFSSTFTPRAVAGIVALVMVGAMLVVTRQMTFHPHQWQPYSDEALAEAQAQNKLVFVEFTADWCGNCHWLEATVINDRSIVELLNDHDAIMLKADVTDEDAPGLRLLGELSAVRGIPLTALYPPGDDRPIVLTGIYSKNELRDAVAIATGPTRTAVSMR